LQRAWEAAPGDTAGGRHFIGRTALAYYVLFVGLWSATGSAQQGPDTLSAEQLQNATSELRATLAGTNEEAYRQILTMVEIVRDPVLDTTSVYDIVIHFDPDRYTNPRVGSYPLSFDSQLIHWGRRVALFAQRTSWQSGRLYLRDISTAHEAWIRTSDARLLMGPMRKKLPFDTAQWLRFVYSLPPYVDLHSMSAWLRLIHPESRELANRRRLREIEAESKSLLKDLKP